LQRFAIRIFLPAGSYAPQFSWPGRPGGLNAAAVELPLPVSDATHPHTEVDAASSVPAKPVAWTWRTATLGLAVLGMIAIAYAGWYAVRPSALKQFWEPFVRSPEPILFCIADQSQYSTIRLRDAADPQKEITLNDSMVTIIIDDVSPLVNVAGLLRTYGKNYRVLGEASTTLTDLRRGPSVFIGAFDNGWTLRLTAPLRFRFANDPAMTRFWIEDRSNPGKRDWMLDRTVQQQTGTYKDYAIVARFVEPNTDQFALVAARIGRGGTVAAGEFLVDPHRMEDMLSQVSGDWKHKNLEIVLETQVIEGRSGPPHIASAHVW
jgi:hypothetical protein